MHQGNWKCSGCGGAITELPFQPRSEKGLTCRSCYGKSKGGQSAPEMPSANLDGEPPDIPFEAGLAGEPMPPADFEGAVPATPGERPKFTGEWQCAGCGNAITSLPFAPRTTNNLKCLDCFKKSKG